mgnify:CR=1 FL=1
MVHPCSSSFPPTVVGPPRVFLCSFGFGELQAQVWIQGVTFFPLVLFISPSFLLCNFFFWTVCFEHLVIVFLLFLLPCQVFTMGAVSVCLWVVSPGLGIPCTARSVV